MFFVSKMGWYSFPDKTGVGKAINMQSYSLHIPAEKQAFHFIFILVEREDLLLYYSDTCIEQSRDYRVNWNTRADSYKGYYNHKQGLLVGSEQLPSHHAALPAVFALSRRQIPCH
jgi:hypothetical protein